MGLVQLRWLKTPCPLGAGQLLNVRAHTHTCRNESQTRVEVVELKISIISQLTFPLFLLF